MAHQKIPVQRGEWAGAFPRRLGRIIFAAFAVVAHALDVLAAGHIG